MPSLSLQQNEHGCIRGDKLSWCNGSCPRLLLQFASATRSRLGRRVFDFTFPDLSWRSCTSTSALSRIDVGGVLVKGGDDGVLLHPHLWLLGAVPEPCFVVVLVACPLHHLALRALFSPHRVRHCSVVHDCRPHRAAAGINSNDTTSSSGRLRQNTPSTRTKSWFWCRDVCRLWMHWCAENESTHSICDEVAGEAMFRPLRYAEMASPH